MEDEERLGSNLSLLLFNIYDEETIKVIKEKCINGVKIQGEKLICLDSGWKREGIWNILNGMGTLVTDKFRLQVD